MFNLMHVSGAMARGVLGELPDLLDELATADAEHPDVAVQHEDGLSLTVVSGWRLIVEDVESGDDPRWAQTTNRQVVLDAMKAVSSGGLPLEAGLDWAPGYGPK